MALTTLKIGMDYYHESMGYNTQTVAQTLQDMQSIALYADRVKIYHNPFTNNGGVDPSVSLAACQMICQQALAAGLPVSWVENVDNSGGYLTDTNWPTYVSLVQADAITASQAGASEFYVGNEIYSHNNGDPGFADLPARIKTLASSVTFPGVIGYEAQASELTSWVSEGIGSMGKIMFNFYSTESSLKSQCHTMVTTFGSSAEIGEFSTVHGFETDSNSDQDIWCVQMGRLVNIIQTAGVSRSYAFEWRSHSTTFGQSFLTENGVYLQDVNIAIQALVNPGGRRFLTT